MIANGRLAELIADFHQTFIKYTFYERFREKEVSMAGDRKNYVIGFLSGVVVVMAFFILSGATVSQSEIGRYQSDTEVLVNTSVVVFTVTDTLTGEVKAKTTYGHDMSPLGYWMEVSKGKTFPDYDLRPR
jgi:hypothetical protein